MFIHRFPGQGTDEVGLGAVGEGEGLGQCIERLATDGALGIVLFLLVTLPGLGLKEILMHNNNTQITA